MPEKVRFKVEQLLPWGFLGVIITVMIGLGTYFLTIKEKAPNITYEMTEYNVLDLHRPLKDLSISFRGQDIQDKKLNLRIYSITVKNDGDTNIRQMDFDQNKPWGLLLSGGQIIDQPRLVYASTDYIRENINPKTVAESEVDFSKIIFEKGQSFAIEIQVLHQAASNPVVRPIGKIAGIESVQLIQRKIIEQKASIWAQTFEGQIGVQFIRFFAYLIAILIIFIGVILIAVAVSDASEKARKNGFDNKVSQYLQPLLATKGEKGQALIKELFHKFRGNVDSIKTFLDALLAVEKIENGQAPAKGVWVLIRDHQRMLTLRVLLSELLFEEADQEKNIHLNPRAIVTIEEFIAFLRDNPLPEPIFKLSKRQTMDEMLKLQMDNHELIETMERIKRDTTQ